METNTQTQTFGNYIPHYLREELTKAREKQQAETPSEAQPQTEETQVEPQTEEPAETSTPQAEPQQEGAPHSEDDNDVKAWKGRLKKAQAERQQLNARLIEESEARAQAEARIKALEKEKETAKSQTPPVTAPKGLSDTEWRELEDFAPELYSKVKNALTQPAQPPEQSTEQPKTATQAQPTTQETPAMSERDRIWYSEVQREIPEIQGSLGDPNFVEFARNKVDWTGGNALDFIQYAGSAKDVRMIPAIRNLLDEYEQSKTTVAPAVTVPPQKSAPVKAKVTTPKTMTAKDEAHAEMLARQGKTKELKTFLAQFK